jgi:hypothetical protein
LDQIFFQGIQEGSPAFLSDTLPLEYPVEIAHLNIKVIFQASNDLFDIGFAKIKGAA